MIYLALFLLLLIGASCVCILALLIAACCFVCKPMLRATRQIDALIHQGVTCVRCGSLMQGEVQNSDRGDEIFLEVRSEGGTRRVAMGSGLRDKYRPDANREEEKRVTARM